MTHKKRCCPKCGFDYGWRWITTTVPSARYKNSGFLCQKCKNAVLFLDRKNAVYAHTVFFLMGFPAAFLAILTMRAAHILFPELNQIAEDWGVLLGLPVFFALYALIAFLVTYVFSIIIPKLTKNIGNLSHQENPEWIIVKKGKRWEYYQQYSDRSDGE